MDSQTVEMLGRNRLTDELLRAEKVDLGKVEPIRAAV
jgi:hypothetical protein